MKVKYLFTYTYEAKKDSQHVNGSGSIIIDAGESDKVTYSMIFGSDGAISMVKRSAMEMGMYEVKVAPMGWFKFDE